MPKIRLLFKVDDQYRTFWWIDYQNQELYWGSSLPAQKLYIQDYDGKSMNLDASKLEKQLPPIKIKASYHCSGRQHVKNNHLSLKKNVMNSWPKKAGIKQPFRFCTIISGPPIKYPEYRRSIKSKSKVPIIFAMNGNTASRRFYCELYLCPEGTFAAPIPMLNLPTPPKEKPMTYSLDQELILAIRAFPLHYGSHLHSWHPEIEMAFFDRQPKA